MNSVSSNQSNVSVQLSLFDAIKDLLFVHPVFWLGIIAICIILIIVLRKNKKIPKTKVWILALVLFVFYYYLYIMLTKIVGIPTLREYIRLSRLGESFFHPNINLIPFSEGVSLGFVFNIFLFIPLGFLCPIISKKYQCIKNAFFMGCGLSLTIEVVQLFTLYRETDIDDLITNVVGTLIGYFCFRFVHKVMIAKFHKRNDFTEPYYMHYMPVIIIGMTFVLGFFS